MGTRAAVASLALGGKMRDPGNEVARGHVISSIDVMVN